LRTTLPVFPLTVAMVESTFRTVLMATIRAPALLAQGRDPTLRTAIPLAAIARATDAENRVAPTAYPLPKNNLALIRHPGRQVGLDKDDSSWQGKTVRC
jgi:hypothetical protein